MDDRFFTAADGTRLAWRETGEGRPLVQVQQRLQSAREARVAERDAVAKAERPHHDVVHRPGPKPAHRKQRSLGPRGGSLAKPVERCVQLLA